jgi:hypothetical protein
MGRHISRFETLDEKARALAVGEQDQFCENNRQFSARLWEKGVWYALHL